MPQNGIQYNGGPVVMNENVVAIYWSNSTIYANGPTPGTTGAGSADGSLIGYFLSNLGGTPYYNINTTYTDGSGNALPNNLAYTGFWANNQHVPTGCAVVSNTAIQNEIIYGFNNGKLTYDPNTVYAVFTAGQVNWGGNFGNCNGANFQYCAYHGSFNWNGKAVLMAAMPYDYQYQGSCTAFQGGGPANGSADPGADAEVNTLAHELEEAKTDPQLNAWWVSNSNSQYSGDENADMCAWTFGTVAMNGGTANVSVGTKNFLVQRNWLNASGGSCQQSYTTTAATVPGAPTLSSATAGNAQVSLSWSAPSSNGGSSVTGYTSTALPRAAARRFSPRSAT